MSKKILIIDDNQQDFKIIQRFIERLEYEEVIYADSGESGLAQYEQHKPEIVIVDTRLPGADGFEVCKKIKESSGEKVKVIVLTGQIDAIDAGKAREAGADDYCVKTADCEPLIKILKDIG